MASKAPTDPVSVTRRAKEIADAKRVQYWIVVDCHDVAALMAGTVTERMMAEVKGLFHRDPHETQEAYIARLQEAHL